MCDQHEATGLPSLGHGQKWLYFRLARKLVISGARMKRTWSWWWYAIKALLEAACCRKGAKKKTEFHETLCQNLFLFREGTRSLTWAYFSLPCQHCYLVLVAILFPSEGIKKSQLIPLADINEHILYLSVACDSLLLDCGSRRRAGENDGWGHARQTERKHWALSCHAFVQKQPTWWIKKSAQLQKKTWNSKVHSSHFYIYAFISI